MFPFAKRSEEESLPQKKKVHKKEPVGWTSKERVVVLFVLGVTVFASAILGLSAREWKLPGLPRISLPDLSFEGTIVLEGKKGEETKPVDAKKEITEFKAKTKNRSGVYGFWVVRLPERTEYGISGTEVFQAASLIKMPVLMALYREAEAGNIDLDEEVDGGVTYREMAKVMGKRSDNAAFNKVREKLGDRLVQETIFALGMTATSLSENETTPKDMALLFNNLWGSHYLTKASSDEILEYLTDTIYEEHLAAGVPEDVRVAHKYGLEIHVVNDGGIVYAARPYIVVIMSKGAIESEANAVFPELSKLIYEFEV